MKVQFLFLTIERWHCIDMVLENIRLAEKPEGMNCLCVATGSDKYVDHVSKKLGEMFKEVKIVRNNDTFIEHSQIRYSAENPLVNLEAKKAEDAKYKKVFDAYALMHENLDRTADYYWLVEDDTMFPLNTFRRYMCLLEGLNADVVSGISYYWHQHSPRPRNFWNIDELNDEIGKKESNNGTRMRLLPMEDKESGVVRLGATGFGNMLAKAKPFLEWTPKELENQGRGTYGADIEFFYNCMLKGYKCFGAWDIYLPHITKFENGDIAILGRIDRSLIQIINKQA